MILGVIQRYSSRSRHENHLVSLDKGQQCLVAKIIFLPVGSVEVACILPSTLTDLQPLSRYLLVIIFAFCATENTQLFTSQFHYGLARLCLMQKAYTLHVWLRCKYWHNINFCQSGNENRPGLHASRQSENLKSFWNKDFLIWFVNPAAFTSVLISCAIWCLIPHRLWKYWVSKKTMLSGCHRSQRLTKSVRSTRESESRTLH